MDNSDKQNAKFLGNIEPTPIHEQTKEQLFESLISSLNDMVLVAEEEFGIDAIQFATRGRKCFGGTAYQRYNPAYERAQKVLYYAKQAIEKFKEPTYFMGTENGIADIETPPSDN